MRPCFVRTFAQELLAMAKSWSIVGKDLLSEVSTQPARMGWARACWVSPVGASGPFASVSQCYLGARVCSPKRMFGAHSQI